MKTSHASLRFINWGITNTVGFLEFTLCLLSFPQRLLQLMRMLFLEFAYFESTWPSCFHILPWESTQGPDAGSVGKERGTRREARGRTSLLALGSLSPHWAYPWCAMFCFTMRFYLKKGLKIFEISFLSHLSFRGEDHNVFAQAYQTQSPCIYLQYHIISPIFHLLMLRDFWRSYRIYTILIEMSFYKQDLLTGLNWSPWVNYTSAGVIFCGETAGWGRRLAFASSVTRRWTASRRRDSSSPGQPRKMGSVSFRRLSSWSF